MGSSQTKRLLAVGIPERVHRALAPLFLRSSLEIRSLYSPTRALELLGKARVDCLVAGYPLPEMPMQRFLAGLRHSDSASRGARVMIAVEREHRGRLSPWLDHVTGVVSPGDDPLLLRHAVSDLLGVAPRSAARLMIRVDLSVGEDVGSRLVQSVDISTAGALIDSEVKPPIGSEITFKIFLPGDSHSAQGTARVVRHADPERDGCRGFAIHYVGFSADGREALTEFLGNS